MRNRLLLLTLGIALLAGPPSAHAQGDGLGFGIRALGDEATRGYFFFREVAPGSTYPVAIRVTNLTRRDKQIVLRAQDATSSGSGGLAYSPPRDGDGDWLEPESIHVDVAARTETTVTFRLRVPADAGAGDHFAGVVAYNATDLRRLKEKSESEQAVQLKFISRLAIPVRSRVPGDLVAKVIVKDIDFKIQPSGSAVEIVFENTGNVLIPESTGRANVSKDGAPLATRKIDLTSFTPGSELRYPIPFEGAPQEGDYRVTGFLQPQFAPEVKFDETITFGSEQTQALEEQGGITVPSSGGDGGGGVPWAVVVGILVLLLVLALAARYLRRRPAPAQVPTTTQPVPVTTPVAAPVDINTAGVDELAQLPGVGPAAARRIVEYRDEYGRFGSLDELSRVEGFDADRVVGLSDRATVG